jgi:hypothetical protein
MAVLGEPIDQSGGEMRVLEKRAPVAKWAVINEGIKSRLGVRLNDIVPVAMKRVAF